MEDLPRAGLTTEALALGQGGEGGIIRHRPPQPLGHVRFGDLGKTLRNAGAAEILLREHVGRDLAPVGGHVDAGLAEDDRSIGIANLGIGSTKRDPFEGRFSCLRKPTLEAH